MKTIDISDETFAALARLAQPLVDTPDSVIRRLLSGTQDPGNAEPTASYSRVATGSVRTRGRTEMVPETAYYSWLINVLGEAGGRLDKADATDTIGRIFKKRLTTADMEMVSSGESRWANKVAWARNRLKELGYLSSNSPRGVWELTEKGWAVFRSKNWPSGWEVPA